MGNFWLGKKAYYLRTMDYQTIDTIDVVEQTSSRSSKRSIASMVLGAAGLGLMMYAATGFAASKPQAEPLFYAVPQQTYSTRLNMASDDSKNIMSKVATGAVAAGLALGGFANNANAISNDALKSLSYEQVKGTGLANRCTDAKGVTPSSLMVAKNMPSPSSVWSLLVSRWRKE